MFANDMKKGQVVRLKNSWRATIMDNKLGLTRLMDVEGYVHAMGSVYVHDIAYVYHKTAAGFTEALELTPRQQKQDARVRADPRLTPSTASSSL